MHLFAFDPFYYAEGRTPLCGFPKTGPNRCRFHIESVEDLKRNLAETFHGHDGAGGVGELYTRWGPTSRTAGTAQVFRELAKEFVIEGVYAFHEICSEELKIQKEVE